ncbi:recombinase family protein [Planococcus halocryophilus]|uniref:recombinase family protein n=1 Tax=Planococcus halocryophilus TaxID=1215089 RepID=UPI001F0D7B0F|nr:recombinase family protein [Planococcus halocryophilus]MCH4826642.1 recombinase family protein [Planococcus halocryophilus]
MRYGYARVSSMGQELTTQINALSENGCEKIFKEKVSGRDKKKRIEFEVLLSTVSEGDTIVVSKLDRFARSTKDALSTIEQLNEMNVNLVVLNMGGDRVDTSTAIGKLMITVLSGIAEFEADMIKERQMEGIALAKQRGVYKGRPHTYTEKHKGLQHALELFYNRDTNKMTVKEIEEITKVSKATIYREVRKQNDNILL